MSTIKPYNELKRQNTIRKILKFFFVFFENNIRQSDKIKSPRSCMLRKLIFKIVSQLTLNLILPLSINPNKSRTEIQGARLKTAFEWDSYQFAFPHSIFCFSSFSGESSENSCFEKCCQKHLTVFRELTFSTHKSKFPFTYLIEHIKKWTPMSFRFLGSGGRATKRSSYFLHFHS